MTELMGDKRYMKVHQAMKSTSMKKNFCGQYVGASNIEEFGYWDDVFGETPLYLEAVTEWGCNRVFTDCGFYERLCRQSCICIV